MVIPFFRINAFTDRPFAGNPAAVCLLETAPDEAWLPQVAREMNLSETAFVLRRPDGFGLRWLTPSVEVDLCGHATLAAAHALWQIGWIDRAASALFHTRSGLLTAARRDGWILLDFPEVPVEPGPVPREVIEALGVEPLFAGVCGPRWLVEVASARDVRAVRPDFARLRSVPGRAVIVTAAADPGADCDIVSRYFAPWVGVDEDPVTGAAHCALAPYWCDRLGRAELTAVQASPRGGRLRLRRAGGRVELAGQAVTVIAGELRA